MTSLQGLECVCPVDAAPVFQFAESLKDQNKSFEDARGNLHKARTAITSNMTSQATDSLIEEIDQQIARIDETVTHRQTLIDATMTFHDEIVTCHARFSNIIYQAVCNGLTVDDNTIIDPALSGVPQSGSVDLDASYDVARQAAYYAYSDFANAEETYRQTCASLIGILPWLDDYFGIHPDLQAIPTSTGYASATADAAVWGTIAYRHSVFRPRDPGTGRFISKQEMGVARQAWERTKPNNWSAAPGHGRDELRLKGWAARGSRLLGRAAVVGAVVDGEIAAWNQWEADSTNPTMGQGERIPRAATSGTFSGGRALGDALAGAKFGAFPGSFTANPIGIAVSGAVGGIVGGLIGSGLGQWAANGVNSFMSDQIHE